MFMKNMIVYRLPEGWSVTVEELTKQLEKNAFQGCGTSENVAIGWTAPQENSALVHTVNNQHLLAIKREEKILPAAVVARFAKERARKVEEEEGRRVGRKEMRELREEIAIELLPRAFTLEKQVFVWIDPRGWIVVDTSSTSRAEEALELLRKSIDPLPVIKLVNPIKSPSACMSGWLANNEAPTGFTLDQDLELCSAEKAKVRYVKHTLEGEQIKQYLAEGKTATKLALTWADKISFILTDNLQIKRLVFLDILKEQSDGQAENEDERFDLDFTLMAGELSQLLTALLSALGGEAEAQ